MTGALVNESTLLAAFEGACRRWPARTAIIHRGQAMTFAELWEAAAAQAALYRSLGIRRGDRVLCALPNRPEHLVTVGAAWARGAVHVGVDHTLTVPELSWLIEHTGATALVVGPHLDADGEAALSAARPDTRVLRVDRMPELVPGASTDDAGEPEPRPEDTALIIFSSGTTGRPKGSVASHGRFANGWLGTAAAVGFGPEDVHLGQVPISHGYGLQLAMMALLTGGSVVLTERFSADEALALIDEHGITALNGTPSHYIGVLAAADRRRARGEDAGGASLRVGIGSADHFPPRLLARIFDELGMDFMNMYGSNMGFGVATMDRDLLLRGSVGRTMPGSLAIVDAQHRPLAVGSVGEIAFRFRPGGAGLWGRPEGGDPMLDEVGHWYYTGDLGRLDAEGNLYLSGRVKHQVNRGGMKIDPAEVANELFGCRGVADAAVIGTPDDFLGEIVCACVVPRPTEDAPTLEELRRALGASLAPHKLPEELCLVDEIPRTVNGKVEIAVLLGRVQASDRRERLRGEARVQAARVPGLATRDEAAAPSAAAVEPEELERAAASLRPRLEEARSRLPGMMPAVLDEIIATAVEHLQDAAAMGPEEASGFLRPSLAVATPGLRAAFESLVLPPAPPPSDSSRQVSFREALAALVQELTGVHGAAGEAERVAYRLLLGCSLRRLIPHEHLPRGKQLNMAAIVLACLARLQSDTVLYVGRPEFLTNRLLERLQAEAEERRAGATVVHHYQIADLGPAAEELATSDDLRALVSGLVGPMAANRMGKYVYCDESTRGLGVHIGSQPFAVNAELKLAHEHPSGPAGRLTLWPPYGEKQPLDVSPGEFVLWYAGGVPHVREDPEPDERMTAVSVFFEPLLRP
jgi:acyl-CoA synthetase (AMP-forming)/AMP-acid ligase II